MSLPVRPYAALALARTNSLEVERFLRVVAQSLSRFDADGGAKPRASIKHGAVAGETIIVKVTTDVTPKEGTRVVFRIAPRPNTKKMSLDRNIEVLSDIVMRALQRVDARHVEWLDERTKLSPEEFQVSCSYVSPKRARREMVEAPITERSVEAIEESLAKMFNDIPPVAEPGHGKERAERVARARAEAQKTLADRVPKAYADWQNDDEDTGTASRTETAGQEPDAATEPPSRQAGLGRLVRALMPRRTTAHVIALGGVALVFWKHGLFDPLLRIVGS
ncbi:hypothetical protein SAMN05421853_103111 [Roseivivax halotolerans]|uniref:Uncharacterized protein n=1 Tax=Roseivivax halotolerans TaxID=93684 RepID=A0A1I5X2V3_9RHOB|nr:hypothetical protein [Roseivivax halotolerans]SFQ26355.1 hypothetical protein SAMN05421853_103111 [Roseivivax halotolerans]